MLLSNHKQLNRLILNFHSFFNSFIAFLHIWAHPTRIYSDQFLNLVCIGLTCIFIYFFSFFKTSILETSDANVPLVVWNNSFSYWSFCLRFISGICHVGGEIWFKLGGEGSSILGWVREGGLCVCLDKLMSKTHIRSRVACLGQSACVRSIFAYLQQLGSPYV